MEDNQNKSVGNYLLKFVLSTMILFVFQYLFFTILEFVSILRYGIASSEIMQWFTYCSLFVLFCFGVGVFSILGYALFMNWHRREN